VHIALSDENGFTDRAMQLPGERDRVRFSASQVALDMVRRYYLYSSASKNSARSPSRVGSRG
jgi:hypothetical protein